MPYQRTVKVDKIVFGTKQHNLYSQDFCMADRLFFSKFAEFSTSKKDDDYTGVIVVIIIVVVCASILALFLIPMPVH
jgi:hypothetical protein